MQPLVSIIIPTYNRAHLISETLDSIVNQTYQNWECIVIDDGSTDDTDEFMAGYMEKDDRFQYFRRPSNKPKGANACRNYGYEKSKGEFIQWFDSDDHMHLNKLQLKIKYALLHEADVIIATHTTDENYVLPEQPEVETFKSADFYVDYILGKKPVITNDVMVKRLVIGSLRFDENLHKAQEYEFFTRLFEQKLTYCFMEIPLSYYSEGQDSISKQTSKGNPKQVESLIYLSKLIKKRHKNNPLIVAKAERLGRKIYKSLIQKRNIKKVFQYFNFFRTAYNKGIVIFFLYVWYNLVTGRGFDNMKPNNK